MKYSSSRFFCTACGNKKSHFGQKEVNQIGKSSYINEREMR